MPDSFDYIIVGAGSAGCVLANRLSADPEIRVLLLEAGGSDRHWTIRIPAAVRENIRKANPFNWGFESEPQVHLDDRPIPHPRGKVLGGSSSLNGMVYLRGHPLDYERWVKEGAAGWGFSAVLPYFKRVETFAGGADTYRGGDGPVRVGNERTLSPLNAAFLDAGRQAGYPYTSDVNGYQQTGFCRFDMNIDAGVRASTAHAYLHPARRRPNLMVETHARVTRILLEGRRSTGVCYSRGDRAHQCRADREVILAAGAFGSPQLLMLSGVGPAGILAEQGIPLVCELPGVGENLQDHLEVHLQYECSQPVALNRVMTPVRRLSLGVQWYLFKSGMAATNQAHVGAFLHRRRGEPHPDIEIHFWPAYFDGWNMPADRHGFRLGVGPMRPTSRGALRLRSADPHAPPAIDFNYCATEADRTAMRECLMLGREIVAQPAFDGFRAAEIDPGAHVQGDADMDAFVRAHATTAWHPVGTCKMSGNDPLAVVDSETRVLGVDGLRVVDASIMPSLVSSNPNAVVMMMAERAADIILGRSLLEPIDAPFA